MSCTLLRSQASIMRSQSCTRGRERLLAQHVQAGLGGADRPVRRASVLGSGDVHRVDGAAVEQLVARRHKNRVSSTPIAPAELRELGGGVRNQGGELDVRARVSERRQDRGLGDVAEPDDREAQRTR